ncbi:glycosyltransferase family 39 protein [bacterium AH-315-M05]|nr:glycosyltransferase family 39 protein [bacterium AH-315-M05]
MNKKHLPFWLITLSVFVVLILPILIKDGMFMDGQQYACVSKNLADGLGTFWFPFLSESWWKSESRFFLEHPPLVYGIQSLFFKVLGDSMYVERFYSFLTAIITAYLILLTWKLILNDNAGLRKLSWLPILFWIIIPVCYWSYQNNMQENTMGIFTLASVYFTLKGLNAERKIFIYLLLSGTSIFLASFSKGIPGFFPIVVVGLYWLINRNISFPKIAVYSAILIFIPILFYSIILLNNEAYESLTFYLNERVLYRIQDEPTVDSRFYIVSRLFMELLPILIIIFILLTIYRSKSIRFNYNNEYKNNIILFLLIGGSGSLSLILTSVQKGFYFVPSLPFYAIGFALIVAPGLKEFINRIDIEKKSFKIFKTISFILLVIIIIFSGLQAGKKGRDHNVLHDIYLIGEVVPKSSLINIDESMYNQWGLQFYLLRHFNISVDPSNKQHDYYLIEKKMPRLTGGHQLRWNTISLEKYKKVPLMTKKYDLYQIKINN